MREGQPNRLRIEALKSGSEMAQTNLLGISKIAQVLEGNGCPGRDRTYDQVINSFLVSLFSRVCICPLLTSLTDLFS